MTSGVLNFDRGVARLEQVLREPTSMTQREAATHVFEFAFELGWKSVHAELRRRGVDLATPRDCLGQALRLEWIEDEEAWLDMLHDRNLTSHTYREDIADEVYRRLPTHAGELRKLARRLRPTETK